MRHKLPSEVGSHLRSAAKNLRQLREDLAGFCQSLESDPMPLTQAQRKILIQNFYLVYERGHQIMAVARRAHTLLWSESCHFDTPPAEDLE